MEWTWKEVVNNRIKKSRGEGEGGPRGETIEDGRGVRKNGR